MSEENPLKGYFRREGPHVKLPSGGHFYPPGMIELTLAGEVPIKPMTATDEMMLQSPDALLSNFAIQHIIQSCVPAVKNPLGLCSIDVDALIVWIRIATYGPKSMLDATCPKCQAEASFEIDLQQILDNAPEFQKEYPVRVNDEVVIYLRPLTFEMGTKVSMIGFEQASKLRNLVDDQTVSDDDKVKIVREASEKLAELNADMLIGSVYKVAIPNAEVTNREHIREFIKEIDAGSYKVIDEAMKKLNVKLFDHEFPIVCEACGHQYALKYEFNPANFFARVS